MVVKSTSAKSRTEQGNREVVTRKVRLEGLTAILFDRYPGDNDTKLNPWQKVYLMPDGEGLCLPALNIRSFLCAENTKSAPKVLLDSRKYKVVAMACGNYVSITPDVIPFLRDGEPIRLGNPNGDVDTLSGCVIDRCVARLKEGIPNPKERPKLPLPWALEFTVTLLPNSVLQEQMLHWLFEQGGIALGLGTFRGTYGKFRVAMWE